MGKKSIISFIIVILAIISIAVYYFAFNQQTESTPGSLTVSSNTDTYQMESSTTESTQSSTSSTTESTTEQKSQSLDIGFIEDKITPLYDYVQASSKVYDDAIKNAKDNGITISNVDKQFYADFDVADGVTPDAVNAGKVLDSKTDKISDNSYKITFTVIEASSPTNGKKASTIGNNIRSYLNDEQYKNMRKTVVYNVEINNKQATATKEK